MFRCGAVHWSRRCRKPVKVTESLRAIGSVTTYPVATCSAAMMERVPLRTYSNSRRARRPGAGGRCGYLLDGRFTGHLAQALDTACTLYLASTGDHPPEPLKDLRGAAWYAEELLAHRRYARYRGRR